MEIENIEIEILENKLKVLNDIWANYFYTYPFFKNKIKFTEEEKTNYVGVIFGYFRDSFDVVFTIPPKDFASYVEKFTYQIALLQSIYVQQDLTEELLRIFKTGINRDTLNNDPNFKINRDIRNELVGHPISRNTDFSLRSSTVFGYEKSGNSIHYLKYEFPEERDVVQTIEINDLLRKHIDFLNTYLDKLLEKSYLLLGQFKKSVIDVLGIHLSKTDLTNTIKFSLSHFEQKFDNLNEILLSQVEELVENHSHPRYKHALNLYWEFITDFYKDTTRSIDVIISKENLKPKEQIQINNFSLIPKIIFVEQSTNNYDTSNFVRKNYNDELRKIYTKRNLIDFELYAKTIISEKYECKDIINEIDYLRQNLFDKFHFNCSWNYLEYLIELETKSTI